MPSPIRVSGWTKSFGNVSACQNVSLDLMPGEVLGLVGQNGAGKSTLMKMLSGSLGPDSGGIMVGKKMFTRWSTKAARRCGIEAANQVPDLMLGLTVLENIIVGGEQVHWGDFVDRQAAAKSIQTLATQLEIEDLPLAMPLRSLPQEHWCHVPILRALVRRPRVLLLDEPTAQMPPQQIKTFLAFLRAWVSTERSVILVSHRLDEVATVADRVVVMHQGQVNGTLTRPFTVTEIVAKMGWEPRSDSIPIEQSGGVMSLPECHEPIEGAVAWLGLRAAETVGVLALPGHGGPNLARSILDSLGPGARDETAARARPVVSTMAHIPAEINRWGLAHGLDVAHNAVVGFHRTPAWRHFGLLSWPSIRSWCSELLLKWRVVTGGTNAPIESLSGGNRQRLVIARELERDVRVLVAESPFKGLDVAAQSELRAALGRYNRSGRACIVITSEPSDVLDLCHRVLVMRHGIVSTSFSAPLPDVAELTAAMSGAG